MRISSKAVHRIDDLRQTLQGELQRQRPLGRRLVLAFHDLRRLVGWLEGDENKKQPIWEIKVFLETFKALFVFLAFLLAFLFKPFRFRGEVTLPFIAGQTVQPLPGS